MYNQYSASLFGIISRVVNDKRIAEEVLQKSMLKAWNSFDTYDENKSSLYTWLSVISRNTAIDTVRLKGFVRNKKTESYDITVHNSETTNTDTSKVDVQKLMSGIDPKYRILLQKMYLEGYSQREISEELDIPLGTVKTRLRMAMQQLRETLKNEKSLFLGFLLFLSLIIFSLWI